MKPAGFDRVGSRFGLSFTDSKIDKIDRRQLLITLIDVEIDPQETLNAWPQRLVRGKTLTQMLNWQHHQDATVNAALENTESVIEPAKEVEENLRALGYL